MKLISVFVLAFASILIYRLYDIQIVKGEEYNREAEKQYFRLRPNSQNRGSIFFSNKDSSLFPAAIQKIGFIITIDPSIISTESHEYTFEKLASVIELERDFFMERVQKKETKHQEIAKRVDLEKAEKIRKLNLSGVFISQERWRSYPGETLAAHALGFVGYQGDELAGRYGLERTYEKTLKRSEESSFANFFAEVFSNVKESVSSDDSSEVSEKEGNIVATIEPQVQAFLEEELKSLNDKWGAKYSGGIIIDPNSGELIAMSVFPHFDANNLKNEKDISIFNNPMVENVYEMGSIMKALTMASGLDAGVVTPMSVYYDEGVIYLDNRAIYNFDGKGRGLVDMQSVLNNSLNTGAAFVVGQMGKNKFAKYMFDFGLGERTGIDLPNEAANLVNNLQSVRDVEYATASFGQGIAVTPISMVRALSALANGGFLIKPHFIKKIDYTTGLSKNISFEKGRRVIKEETSEEISRMLTRVVDEALLGGTVKMENYSVAAKTGTAQIAKEDAREYYDDKFFHTFFGYFPSFDPKFLVFIFSYDPRGVRYASETLTLPFVSITKYLINYYEIPPDR